MTTRKQLIICSGATPIGSAGRAPEEKGKLHNIVAKDNIVFEPTTKYKHLVVASGATPIGNAAHAPDDFYACQEKIYFE